SSSQSRWNSLRTSSSSQVPASRICAIRSLASGILALVEGGASRSSEQHGSRICKRASAWRETLPHRMGGRRRTRWVKKLRRILDSRVVDVRMVYPGCSPILDLRNGRCDETQQEDKLPYRRPREQQKMAHAGLLNSRIPALCS